MRKISSSVKPSTNLSDISNRLKEDEIHDISGKVIEEIIRDTDSPVGSISSLKNNSNTDLNELVLRTSPFRSPSRKPGVNGSCLRHSATSIHSNCSGCSHAPSNSSETDSSMHKVLTQNEITVHSDSVSVEDGSSVILHTNMDSSYTASPRVIQVEEAWPSSGTNHSVSRGGSQDQGSKESILKSPERKGKIRISEGGATRVTFQESLV